MALIREVLQNKVSGKWAYIEYSDENEKAFTILGGIDFDEKEQAEKWAKGYAPDSYEYIEPKEVKREAIVAEIERTQTYLNSLNDKLAELSEEEVKKTSKK